MAFSKLASVPRARTHSNSSEGGSVGGLSNISTDEQRMPAGRPAEVVGANRKANKPPEQWEQWKVQDQGVRADLPVWFNV